MGGLTRKELLAGAAAAGVVAGCGGSSDKPAYDPRDWASVKAQFALSRDVRHFDAFVLATHPKPVREAIERHRRGLDADPAGYIHAHELELDERVLQAAARYLEVPPDFAFTDSTTMGLGLVYGGIRIEGAAGRHRARLLLDARVAAPALQGLRADPALRRPGAGDRGAG